LFEGLAGLGEAGKGLAGGRQERRRHGGMGSLAAAWKRHKGVGEQLQEVPELLYIGRRERGRGAKPTDHGGVEKPATQRLGRRRETRGARGKATGAG
jgi:hypothetical protein